VIETPAKTILTLLLCLAGCTPLPTEPQPSLASDREPTADEVKPVVTSDSVAATADDRPESGPPFEIVYFVGRELWRIAPDGTDARSLGYEVPEDGHSSGSRVGGGTQEPTVSRDGRWLACLTGTNLLVVELAGDQAPKVHRVTALPPAKDDWLIAANVSYSEWSPDSTTLVVLLEEPGYEEDDPLPLPKGYAYGAHVLRTSGLKLEHAPHIDSYLGWTPDSKAIIDAKYNAGGDYDLLAVPIAGGQATRLHHNTDPYGYTQVSIVGDHIAWTASGDGSTSQVVVMPLFGGEIVPLSPKAKFADIQWPQLSLSGTRAVFQREGKLMLGEGPSQTTAWTVPSGFRWWDDEHVLAVTNAGLVMVDLQGHTRVLDAAATALVHH
jgi:hypothetical protein